MKKKTLIGIALVLMVLSSCTKVNKPVPPKASFSYDYTGYSVNFVSTSETYGAPSTMTWDFGDNTPMKLGETITHAYGGSGIHYVTLTVSNANGYSKYSANIEIKEEIAKISTRFGDMYLWLYNETPNHKLNFLHNVKTLLYDSTTFHKLVPGSMIVGGDNFSKDNDPTNDGRGGPVTMMPEFVDSLHHIYGAVGAARPNDSIDPQMKSNLWQFYIITSASGYPQWNGNHTVFGYVMSGMDVAKQIENQPADANGRPLTDIRMKVIVLRLSKTEIFETYGYKVR